MIHLRCSCYLLRDFHGRKLPGIWRALPRAVVPAVVDVNSPYQPLPAAMVARRLGVSRQLFQSWVTGGKLEPAEHARDGRPLYRTIDAARVETETRRSPNSTRKRRPLVGAAA